MFKLLLLCLFLTYISSEVTYNCYACYRDNQYVPRGIKGGDCQDRYFCNAMGGKCNSIAIVSDSIDLMQQASKYCKSLGNEKIHVTFEVVNDCKSPPYWQCKTGPSNVNTHSGNLVDNTCCKNQTTCRT